MNVDAIAKIITDAQRILIIQADNPDADSLGSALALEQILGELGKHTYLYCGVNVPDYLRYLQGWDRVDKFLPQQYDASIIVDTSALSLLGKIGESNNHSWLATRPCIVIDHHNETHNDISYASVILNDTTASSTGEIIYNVAKSLNWPLDARSGEYIMTAILGDTQGLTNNLASSQTYRTMAELVELGASRPKLEELRREASRMDPEIFRYKAELIKRTEFAHDNQIAIVTVPQDEINTYSPLYNPAPLIQPDMLNTRGVGVALVMKHYDDGKILCSIRCNAGYGIGGDLATAFGGGGHAYASGFKITDGRPLSEIKSECIKHASELLDNLKPEKDTDETLQYTVA